MQVRLVVVQGRKRVPERGKGREEREKKGGKGRGRLPWAVVYFRQSPSIDLGSPRCSPIDAALLVT